MSTYVRVYLSVKWTTFQGPVQLQTVQCMYFICMQVCTKSTVIENDIKFGGNMSIYTAVGLILVGYSTNLAFKALP